MVLRGKKKRARFTDQRLLLAAAKSPQNILRGTRNPATNMADEHRFALLVPRHLVRTIKTRLERDGLLDRTQKIRLVSASDGFGEQFRDQYILHTRERAASGGDTFDKACLLEAFGLAAIDPRPELVVTKVSAAEPAQREDSTVAAVKAWLADLPEDTRSALGSTDLTKFSKTLSPFSIYSPMLLLPSHFSISKEMTYLCRNCPPEYLEKLYSNIAEALGVSHVAVNAPIPLETSTANTRGTENILRSPKNFVPLFGDFGPLVTIPKPSREDFAKAFWVSTKQNGITQAWAPRYTMFSRGNIKEKTRILNLESVKTTATEGYTAVDLYAGVGYFAFSYAKAGAEKVVGFELNPWSVEGFRRGAASNKWAAATFSEEDLDHLESAWSVADDVKFHIFQMDNAKATDVVRRMGNALPPIRHVNCGLLPSSRRSWKTAVAVVDAEKGGWLHIHENIKTVDIDRFSSGVLQDIKQLASSSREVRLEHIERVKTYAPGIMHCVLDIHVSSVS
jgi:tRNA wybutosine-synthesizing protein 2